MYNLSFTPAELEVINAWDAWRYELPDALKPYLGGGDYELTDYQVDRITAAIDSDDFNFSKAMPMLHPNTAGDVECGLWHKLFDLYQATDTAWPTIDGVEDQ